MSNLEFLGDYHAKGVTFYESVLKQVRGAICGKNGIYRKERQKIESTTEAFITTLVPVVLSTARLAYNTLSRSRRSFSNSALWYFLTNKPIPVSPVRRLRP